MFYVVQVKWNNNDSLYHNSVGLVWGETKQQAYEKGQRLFSGYDIYEFKIAPLDLDDIKNVRTRGGAVIASFEDYFE